MARLDVAEAHRSDSIFNSARRRPAPRPGRSRGAGDPGVIAERYHEPKEKRPMTVRWKPLLILSGLFLVTAVLGVIAMVYSMAPGGAGDILPVARAERSAKQYEKSLIHY